MSFKQIDSLSDLMTKSSFIERLQVHLFHARYLVIVFLLLISRRLARDSIGYPQRPSMLGTKFLMPKIDSLFRFKNLYQEG